MVANGDPLEERMTHAWEGFDAETAGRRALRMGENCPICQGTRWDTGGVGAFVPHFRDGRQPPGEGFSAVALICLSCGFMRLHSLDVLHSQTDPALN